MNWHNTNEGAGLPTQANSANTMARPQVGLTKNNNPWPDSWRLPSWFRKGGPGRTLPQTSAAHGRAQSSGSVGKCGNGLAP
eukprot:6492491-Amphidinium_carterae.1